MVSHKPKNLYGGLIQGVNTLYRNFWLFKLFIIGGNGLSNAACISFAVSPTFRAVVTSVSLLKNTWDFGESVSTRRLSRGIFVTDGPLQDTDGIVG